MKNRGFSFSCAQTLRWFAVWFCIGLPNLRRGLRPQAHAANFLRTDTAITNKGVLFRQLKSDRQKGRPDKAVPFLRRYVMAVFEQKSVLFFHIFSHAREKIWPSETRRKRPRRNESSRVRNGFDETSRRKRRLLFSKSVSSFPKRRPSLRFGSYSLSSFPPFQNANASLVCILVFWRNLPGRRRGRRPCRPAGICPMRSHGNKNRMAARPSVRTLYRRARPFSAKRRNSDAVQLFLFMVLSI